MEFCSADSRIQRFNPDSSPFRGDGRAVYGYFVYHHDKKGFSKADFCGFGENSGIQLSS